MLELSRSIHLNPDGFIKSPSAALRFIFRHCSVLRYTPHSSRFERLVPPVAGELFTVPSSLATFYEVINPVRLKTCANKTVEEKWAELGRFRWSSLSGYLFSTKREAFVDYEMVLPQMGGDNRKGRQGYRKFILSELEGELENPLELGRGHGIVEGKDFVGWVKQKLVE